MVIPFPVGKAFRKKLESLNSGDCFIDTVSGLLEDFNSEGWGVDLRMRLVGVLGGWLYCWWAVAAALPKLWVL